MASFQIDGLSLRSFFGEKFISFEDIAGSLESGFRLRAGRKLRLSPAKANQLNKILRGPAIKGEVAFDGDSLGNYCAESFAPRRAAMAILESATAMGASDIHVEAQPDAQVAIRFRQAGQVKPLVTLSAQAGACLMAAFKGLSGCLPYRRDIVQEGKIPRAGVTADVRASFVPTAFGERLALRLFGRLLKLESLGLGPGVREAYERILVSGNGLVLVAGASGAGKTTTLYASLEYVARTRGGAHLSIEDPIEQRLRMAGIPVDQMELVPERGLTGEAALVAALRQDVDVICVGEIRTPAEARLAVQAAHTGRLVLAGIHADSTDEAVRRLVELTVDPELVEKTVLAILHLRLGFENDAPVLRSELRETARLRALEAA